MVDTRRRGEADLLLFLTVFALVGFGIAMSYSASAVYAMKVFGDSFYFLKRQLLWFLVSFIALIVVQRIDYRIYARYTRYMILISLVLLVLVLVPGLGKNVKGSVRWIGFGPVHIQPSEFVKIVIAIYLAKVFSSEHEGVVNHVFQLLIPMLVTGVIFMLVLLQPDFGTAIDIAFVAVAILFVSGFPLAYILSLFVVSIPMFYLLIYQVDYRKNRILAFFNPWENRYGIGYHIVQSFVAFKKGGLLGAGLGFGTQKLKRLPEPHTDFIFAVIAEETGMAGTLLIIILFSLIFWRGIQIAIKAPDRFGRLLAIALTLMIVIQAFLNIGVVTGSIPTTGIPLPFISYGGSSLLASMIAIGVLLNISRYREVAHGVNSVEEVM